MEFDYTVAVTNCDSFADLVGGVNDLVEFNTEENNAIAVDVKYQTACPNEDSVVHYALILFKYKEGYGKIKE